MFVIDFNVESKTMLFKKCVLFAKISAKHIKKKQQQQQQQQQEKNNLKNQSYFQ
jgi:hypothetical protein